MQGLYVVLVILFKLYQYICIRSTQRIFYIMAKVLFGLKWPLFVKVVAKSTSIHYHYIREFKINDVTLLFCFMLRKFWYFWELVYYLQMKLQWLEKAIMSNDIALFAVVLLFGWKRSLPSFPIVISLSTFNSLYI